MSSSGTTTGPVARLTAEDRCDRCGAQAYLRVGLAGGELMLCGHHVREHGPRLREAGAAVLDDDTHLLAMSW